LFENIKNGPLEVPSDMPSDALDLIVKLLNRDHTKRLGAGPSDAEEIKSHPFFKDIDWDKALKKELKPPKPYIKKIKESKEACEAFKKSVLEEETVMDKMENWTFISKEFE